ncbi:hypothetical protein BBO99_00001435 [Phytophthora kernoviae]|uniref:Uncharacterized protein n=2 Tax=Phytophthora kernoviae TaxID=325452 RepID=A0A421F5X5_9STRA|nr:hypothetical protein G195_002147 [Phytophthora kernoviae 00238/432]KAG2530578.1 hypothetical protein JM16_000924 [Phytophthora kernoviae]KAG2531295.1 hypothetical protein JM18_001702 [Phytophthora kernoviae]RLN26125.1 hypothetical protein BBI17_001304 [Phytophthora kernoviae]RLN84355.1 hypothetical protein BBO99_00001435 [Phytophthora kernoviae]
MGSTPTKSSTEEVAVSTPRRLAHWDSKREKCANCELIYLKTLSQHLGFCSVDCKSNMTYLEKVNRTIRAMKDAVDERQQHQEQAARAEPAAYQELHQVEEPIAKQPREASPKLVRCCSVFVKQFVSRAFD